MPLLVEDRGAVRVLSLSNPAKKNALTRELLDELARAVASPGDARCIVLRGDPAGGAFSSGFDIGAITEEERAQGLDPIRGPADVIERSSVPVIAAIHGACMGGALELAVACTVRIAALDAKLCMPPARLGLVYSATGLERFLRAISPSAAQRLFLSAVVIEGAEAARIGLVDLPAPDAIAAAQALADKIAQNAPLAVRGLLDAIRACAKPGGLTDDDREMIDAARELTVHSADLAEGARAFLEKRAPVFSGR